MINLSSNCSYFMIPAADPATILVSSNWTQETASSCPQNVLIKLLPASQFRFTLNLSANISFQLMVPQATSVYFLNCFASLAAEKRHLGSRHSFFHRAGSLAISCQLLFTWAHLARLTGSRWENICAEIMPGRQAIRSQQFGKQSMCGWVILSEKRWFCDGPQFSRSIDRRLFLFSSLMP